MQTLKVDNKGGALWVTMSRPEVKNAFDGRMLDELRQVFSTLGDDVRLVILTGDGNAFCAGADLGWMAQSANLSQSENVEASKALGDIFRVIDEAPRAVIARVNGPAMGGALGLIAACDLVVAVDTVKLGFTEVRLGLVPAVISPFVVRKIGESQARRYFITGELFDAPTAKALGLVHEVVSAERLDQVIGGLIEALGKNGPRAMGEVKKLVRVVTRSPTADAAQYAAETIARLRTSEEGQEGLRAFLEKRRAVWP